ncbi:MAG: hypothetical protein KDB27_00440 [Planctomycetales bacterium]|nr:hypothetical protein [Planctomycetales bacterium]
MNATRLFAGVLVATLYGAAAHAVPLSATVGINLGQTALGQAEQSSREQSDQLLREARAAMRQGKLDVARQHLEKIKTLGARYDRSLNPFADSPARLEKDLTKLEQAAGITPTVATPQPLPATMTNQARMLNLPPEQVPPGRQLIANPFAGNNPQGQPPVAAGQSNLGQPQPLNQSGLATIPAPQGLQYDLPQANQQVVGSPNELATKKAEAQRLVANARLALSRQDFVNAEQFAQQAHALRVPDSAFAPNEPRPWTVLLEVDRAKRQAPVPAGAASSQYGASQAVYQQQQGVSNQVRPAAATVTVTDNRVAQLDNVPTSIEDPFETDPPAAGIVRGGVQLMEEGEQALADKDLEKASELFQKAWQYEAELDPATRQRLQDHLQILRAPDDLPEPEADRLTAGEQAIVRRFVNEVSREQQLAERNLNGSPREAWNRLKDLRERVADADVPPAARMQLLARIDKSIESTEDYIERNRVRIEQDEQNAEVVAQIDRERIHRIDVDKKLVTMIDDFNTLMDQQRYAEAIVLAKKAKEIDPKNTVTNQMVTLSRLAERLTFETELQDRAASRTELALRSISESAVPWDETNLLEFPENGSPLYWESLKKRRNERLENGRRRLTETEMAINRSLREKVRVTYDNAPLGDVLNDLGDIVGISMHLDPNGMQVEGVTSDMPVSIDLNQEIQLKSALNLILDPFGLTYVVQDEVLKITSKDIGSKKVETIAYDVADLVIPIPNFNSDYESGMAGALHAAMAAQARPNGPSANYSAVPAVPPMQMPGNNLYQLNGQTGALSGGTGPAGFGPGGAGGAAQADFDTLMDLIVATIAPDSWDDVGGEGSIREYPNNLSIVVSNTTEIHEQIADLLEQLRRLQDLQVTIEVRFIELSDNFFERIGVDFDFDVDDNVTTAPGDDSGPSVTFGLDPFGNPTADLDLEFRQESFGRTRPRFGGYDPAAAATFGFAILSDIEAYFLVEAAQGDSRTNVLQAPKVTLFNGQQASVNDFTTRPFVTSVQPVVGDFAAAQQPIIMMLNDGTQLHVQAVVSPDRRFVRLTLVPFFSEIGDVEEFTFDGRRTSSTGTNVIDPTDDTQTLQDNVQQDIVGTTVQLPSFAVRSVSTTVSVPDGGTILLGGIKRLREGRDEEGVPMLSKLPYINRLFKNVGISRETQSLMMMVTPRIIIQEEEEERLGIANP